MYDCAARLFTLQAILLHQMADRTKLKLTKNKPSTAQDTEA